MSVFKKKNLKLDSFYKLIFIPCFIICNLFVVAFSATFDVTNNSNNVGDANSFPWAINQALLSGVTDNINFPADQSPLALDPSGPFDITSRVNLTGEKLTLNGDLQFSTGSTFSGIANEIDGNHGMIIQNNITLILSGCTLNYSGDTTINSTGKITFITSDALSPNSKHINNGDLDIANTNQTIGSLEGNGIIGFSNAGSLILGQDNKSTTFSGSITNNPGGVSAITKIGTGTFTITGTTPYEGTFTISNGKVIGTTTSLNRLITNNAVYEFNQTFDGTYSSIISGTGSVIKDNTGTVTVSNSNTYSGSTTITNGTIKLDTGNDRLPTATDMTINTSGELDLNNFNQQIGSLSGSGNISLGSGTLTAGTSSNTTFSGIISGINGNFNKEGTGTLIVTGTNTYTGTTNINAGSLKVNNGSLASPVIVGTNGKLEGNGTINNNVTVNGALYPGSSISTITIIGDYVQNPNSTLEIELNANTSDLVDVTGNITINTPSTLLLIFDPGNHFTSKTYTLMQATGTLTGEFSTVLPNLPTIAHTLQYNHNSPGSLLLTITANPFSDDVSEGNPGRVAEYLDSLTIVEDSDLDNVISILQLLDNENDLSNALNQLHPAKYKGLALTQENNNGLIAKNISNYLHQSPCVRNENKITFWGNVIGDKYKQNSNNFLIPFRSKSAYVLLGGNASKQFSNSTINAGPMIGYSYSDVKWQSNSGSGRVNSAYLGLYSNWFTHRTFCNMALLGSLNDYNAYRNIIFSTINRSANMHVKGSSITYHVKGGFYTRPIKSFLECRPFASLDYQYLHQKEFKEKNANNLDLIVEKSNYNMLRGEIGFNFATCLKGKKIILNPDFKISYVREQRFGGNTYKSKLIDQDLSFTISGIKPNENRWSPGASLTASAKHKNSLHLFSIKYEGEFGKRYCDNNLLLSFVSSF